MLAMSACKVSYCPSRYGGWANTSERALLSRAQRALFWLQHRESSACGRGERTPRMNAPYIEAVHVGLFRALRSFERSLLARARARAGPRARLCRSERLIASLSA
jgi:hypothetical protein